MIPGFDEMTLDERREALWGLRDGSAVHMNRVRRENFESVKHAIFERDMRASDTHKPAPANVVQFRKDYGCFVSGEVWAR